MGTRRGTLVFAIVVGLGVGIGGGTVLRADRSSPVLDLSVFDPRLDPTQEGVPLLRGGEQVDLSDAVTATPFPIYRPHTGHDSDSTMDEVWVSSGPPPEVAIRYLSGLRVYLTVWPEGQDPAAFYRSFAADSGVGSYQTINGYPAYVVTADAQAPGYPATAVVDVTIGRVEVRLHRDVPLDDLVAAAETLSAS